MRQFDQRTLDVPLSEVVARRPFPHVVQLHLTPTCRYVRITTDDDRVLAYVNSAYGPAVSTVEAPRDRTDEATLLTATSPPTVAFNAVPLSRHAPTAGKNPWTSGAYIVDQFVWRAIASDPDWVPLYACAVDIGGRAVVFAGAGGAGKTTLGLALMSAGALVYGDEMILIHRRRGLVDAISRRLIVRCGSLDVLGNVALAERIRTAGVVWGSGPEAYLALDRAQFGPVPRPAPLAALMFVERGSGVPTLSPLSAARAGVALRSYLGRAVRDFADFASLVRIISPIPCFRLSIGDPQATAAAVAQVMSA